MVYLRQLSIFLVYQQDYSNKLWINIPDIFLEKTGLGTIKIDAVLYSELIQMRIFALF